MRNSLTEALKLCSGCHGRSTEPFLCLENVAKKQQNVLHEGGIEPVTLGAVLPPFTTTPRLPPVMLFRAFAAAVGPKSKI